MKQILLAAVILFGASLNAAGDFAGDFQAAKKLFNERQYEAAHEAFVKLAETAPNPRGKAPSLSYAAISLGRFERYDDAMTLAKTIESAPMAAYTQMTIMDEGRKFTELAEAFKDEDIAAWPDAINYQGFFMRARARNIARDREGALSDYAQCAALAGSDDRKKLEATTHAAALHHALGDAARAMIMYRDVLAVFEKEPRRKGMWLFPHTLLGAAGILLEQKKYDEALALLATYELKPEKEKRNVWDFRVLEARGDACAGQGKKAEALAAYREALEIQTHESYIRRLEQKAAELEGGKGEPQ